ncbi:hypoxia induced protein conserved region-domain-containing protein [Crepidotus variabilis]|uniref:Hypoxia induced protein conserved region-domain-containing protein n=1 Tax=Crepidotus variabilis TaxID=179855 RepID=A0A9P6EKB8_9AGAR|nr:hypoxia induced protein conserved region-domain-containing protein [Crepidotus variabilis]
MAELPTIAVSGATASPPRVRPYQDPLETWSAKFKRKFMENPWVPVGCFLTCGALVMSAYKLRQGRSKEMNHWLRARVAFQGVTIVALVWGSIEMKKLRDAEAAGGVDSNERVQQEARLVKERERREFQERLREAERVTDEEEKLLGRSKPKVVPTAAATENAGVEKKTSKSWW